MAGATRRGLFGWAGGGALLAAAPAAAAADFRADLAAAPGDEAYWARVAALFDKPEGVVQLENGHFGSMARPVRLSYVQKTERVNRDTTLYSRGAVNADMQAARERVAKLLEVEVDEIVFTRGAHGVPPEPDRRLQPPQAGRCGALRRPRLRRDAGVHGVAGHSARRAGGQDRTA